MSTNQPPTSEGASTDLRRQVRGPIAELLGVVVEGQTYNNLAYLVLAFPLGLLYFVILTVGLSLGMGLALLVIGIPILLAVILGSRPVARFERLLANRLLTVDISPPEDLTHTNGTLWSRLEAALSARSTWTGMAFLFLKFWIGVFSFVVVVVGLSLTIAFVTAPVHYSITEIAVSLGPWAIDTLPRALLVVPVGMAIGVISLHLINATAWISGQLARALLGGN